MFRRALFKFGEFGFVFGGVLLECEPIERAQMPADLQAAAGSPENDAVEELEAGDVDALQKVVHYNCTQAY